MIEELSIYNHSRFDIDKTAGSIFGVSIDFKTLNGTIRRFDSGKWHNVGMQYHGLRSIKNGCASGLDGKFINVNEMCSIIKIEN
jgi:hypothetical protein